MMLYSVLHNELWQTPLPFTSLSHEQFVKLQQASAKQTIEGLVMGALIRNNVKLERADALLAYSRTMMIEQLNHKGLTLWAKRVGNHFGQRWH